MDYQKDYALLAGAMSDAIDEIGKSHAGACFHSVSTAPLRSFFRQALSLSPYVPLGTLRRQFLAQRKNAAQNRHCQLWEQALASQEMESAIQILQEGLAKAEEMYLCSEE